MCTGNPVFAQSPRVLSFSQAVFVCRVIRSEGQGISLPAVHRLTLDLFERQILTQHVWGMAWDSAYPISSQVMLVLLAHRQLSELQGCWALLTLLLQSSQINET